MSQSIQIPRVCERCKSPFFQMWTSKNPHLVKRFCSIACRNKVRIVPILSRIRRRLGPPESNGCILWPGGTNSDGRAIVKAEIPRKRMVLVSRTLWEATHGPLPDSIGVLHTCDNPQCVNIAHFFLGTQAVNMADASRKGRCGYKLILNDVKTIRSRYEAGGVTMPQLADEYGVTRSHIRKVVRRETWIHT